MTITLEQFARMMGVTVEQCNVQLAKNRKQLEGMYRQAVKTGKRVNGYSADELLKAVNRIKV